MELIKTTELPLGPSEAMALLLSADYSEVLVTGIRAISGIEELEREERDGVVTRTLRYSAPTASKIPGFLKRYADRAPSHVSWNQRERWDLALRSMSYVIEPEIKPEWRRYYETSGALTLEALSGGANTCMVARLRYEVNVFGFKKLVERALEEEIDQLLTLQGKLALKLAQTLK